MLNKSNNIFENKLHLILILLSFSTIVVNVILIVMKELSMISLMSFVLVFGFFMVYTFNKSEKTKRIILNIVTVLLLIVIFFVPIKMLTASDTYSSGEHADGIKYFLNQKTAYYILIEAMLLLLLFLTGILNNIKKGLGNFSFKKNIIRPLILFYLIRLFWILVMEPRHLTKFAEKFPQLGIDYVVLVSIPLLFAGLLLLLSNNKAGYILGIVLGILHAVLTSILVILRVNPGFGPIIVISSSIGIAVFSFLDLRKFKTSSN